ncbi:ABC transporter substrate-binding protein [Streptomyces profundus]|uniref:ABC transporter substrate-binding protein n=1 Tax=Streptomyces profundus TaxID=2867410 RepID=UPI001D1694E4|nr:ABC transporter substrate-binding protein [Streptomyces sp. MA3_2.13]UED84046.1 ABC transporter substrate-binding protein [Streptomyces sp. MA3_2.13]
MTALDHVHRQLPDGDPDFAIPAASASRRPRAVATGLVLALALSACGAGGGRAETTESGLTRLVIDYSATANNAQLSLGVERGIFERHGIEIEQVPGSGASANSVALLLNGQIDLAVTEITAVPAAVHADFPVQIVTSLVTDYESPQGDAFSLVVPGDSPIRSFADLAGRTVAVNALESFFDLTLREAVRQGGGAPDTVEVVAVPFEDQLAALRQGRVDAVSTIEPFGGQLLTDGFRTIGNPATAALGARSSASVLMASRPFVTENEDVMRRFLDAWDEATAYANDHPDEVRETIVATTGARPEAVADLPLPWYVSGIDRRSAALVTSLMVEYGRLDSAPPLEEYAWSQAPEATDLTTPPRGLEVSE